ncbi:MAG TPA: phosphoribosyl-ATP diphosphatase [Caulobacteraceae bacterium]|jgi:phosphoribosyl-ATP pyrophosphohydrolase
MPKLGETIESLARTIEARRGADPEASWSARLIADPALAAKKLAEEAMETALAAVQGDRTAVVAESADLVYHWLALLAALDIDLEDVADVLRAREGRSGVEELRSRTR